MSNQQIAFTTIQKGSYCGVSIAKELLITNKKDWNEFWVSFCRLVPRPEAPAIDFRKQIVLAVFMGQQRSGGYSIEVSSVELAEDRLIASVKRSKSSGMTTMALTQPFHIVSIPRKRGLQLVVQPAQPEQPSQSMGAMRKTYILMLDVNFDGIEEGDIAERIRTLEGVDSMAEDGPSFSNSRGII